MTKEEIKIVGNLQRRGLGYKKISALTGIGVNTVKAYCRRHKVSESDVEIVSTQVFCRSCGKAIENVPKSKPRQFCSDACRMKWWNAHPDEVKRKAYYTFTCPHCGRQFESYGNNHRKYCSRGCSAAGRRKGGAPDGC